MRVRHRFKRVCWMFVAAMAFAPALAPKIVFALQESAPQAKREEAKPEETRKPGEATPAQSDKDAKALSGMSILGNQEAPKSLVIVPWKSSEIGNSMGVSTMLDDSRLPVDKEVFMRMLSYYEIRSGTAHPGGAPIEKNAAQSTTAANRRKQ
jgi:hypothetical protein